MNREAFEAALDERPGDAALRLVVAIPCLDSGSEPVKLYRYELRETPGGADRAEHCEFAPLLHRGANGRRSATAADVQEWLEELAVSRLSLRDRRSLAGQRDPGSTILRRAPARLRPCPLTMTGRLWADVQPVQVWEFDVEENGRQRTFAVYCFERGYVTAPPPRPTVQDLLGLLDRCVPALRRDPGSGELLEAVRAVLDGGE